MRSVILYTGFLLLFLEIFILLLFAFPPWHTRIRQEITVSAEVKSGGDAALFARARTSCSESSGSPSPTLTIETECPLPQRSPSAAESEHRAQLSPLPLQEVQPPNTVRALITLFPQSLPSPKATMISMHAQIASLYLLPSPSPPSSLPSLPFPLCGRKAVVVVLAHAESFAPIFAFHFELFLLCTYF